MLDRAACFRNLRASTLIIGLTATLERDLLSQERDYICEDLKFNYVDSGMSKSNADQKPAVICDFFRFMSKEFNKMARLVYCHQRDLPQLENLCLNFPDANIRVTRVNCSD